MPNDTRLPLSKQAQLLLKKVLALKPEEQRFDLMPQTPAGDELCSYLLFVKTHGRPPSSEMRWNDVFYRIKSSDEIRNPLRVFVSDKEYVKLFVKAIVGDQYNIPTLAVVRDRDLIERFAFPAECCIKPTHLSGAVILRKDRAKLDRVQIKSWFDQNYYFRKREPNYQYLEPKVIVEPLLFESDNITDYKFFCYQGQVKLIQVDRDRSTEVRRLMYDRDWQVQDFTIAYPRADDEVPAPKNLAEMIRVAETLASHFSFIRVDMYSDGQACFVGELTNCPGNASRSFMPADGELRASQILFGNSDGQTSSGQ